MNFDDYEKKQLKVLGLKQDVLKLDEDQKLKAIKKAYRAEARLHHPDRGEEANEDKFKLANSANIFLIATKSEQETIFRHDSSSKDQTPSSPPKSYNFKAENFLSYAKTGNVEALMEVLARGADINQKNKLGETALMLAIDNNNYQAVQILLKQHDIDLNLINKGGMNAMSYAVLGGYSWFSLNGYDRDTLSYDSFSPDILKKFRDINLNETFTKLLLGKGMMYPFEEIHLPFQARELAFENIISSTDPKIKKYALSLGDEVFNKYFSGNLLLKISNQIPLDKDVLARLNKIENKHQNACCLMTKLFTPDQKHDFMKEAFYYLDLLNYGGGELLEELPGPIPYVLAVIMLLLMVVPLTFVFLGGMLYPHVPGEPASTIKSIFLSDKYFVEIKSVFNQIASAEIQRDMIDALINQFIDDPAGMSEKIKNTPELLINMSKHRDLFWQRFQKFGADEGNESNYLAALKAIDSPEKDSVKHPLGLILCERNLSTFFLEKDYRKLIKDEELKLDNSAPESSLNNSGPAKAG